MLKPIVQRRRRAPIFLSLVLLALLVLGGAGCAGGPFAPQVSVSENVEQAFKDGQDKEQTAQKAVDANRRDDASKLLGEAAAYYGAVANKFPGSENGLKAAIKQAELLEKQADEQSADSPNYASAQVALRGALAKFPATVSAPLHEQAQSEYTTLIEKMDVENAKSPYYKVMDGLVRVLGNDQQVAPILAILAIAVLVTIVTWPLRVKSAKSAKEMARYQPELKKIQEKYKGDSQVLMQKQQEFFKTHGINQFAGCLPMLLQWPVVLLMYQVILHYQFHFRNTHFLWINPDMATASQQFPFFLKGSIAHNLGEQDMFLLLLYACSMYVQSKLTPVTSTDPAAIEQQKMMSSVMPVMFFVMMLQWQLPSAFVLYWFTSNVLYVGQQWWINRTLPTLPPLVLNSDGEGGGVDDGTMKPMSANPKLVSPKNKRRK